MVVGCELWWLSWLPGAGFVVGGATLSLVLYKIMMNQPPKTKKSGPSLNSAMTQRIESTYEAPPKRLKIHVLIAETP